MTDIQKLAEEKANQEYPPFAIGGTDNIYVIGKKKKAYAKGFIAGHNSRDGEVERLREENREMLVMLKSPFLYASLTHYMQREVSSLISKIETNEA